MENTENMKVLMIIVNAGFAEEFMELARECGARGGTIINARGTGSGDKSILGIVIEPEKEMIMSVVSEDIAEKIMLEIKNRGGVKTPANGICICMPVDATTYINKV